MQTKEYLDRKISGKRTPQERRSIPLLQFLADTFSGDQSVNEIVLDEDQHAKLSELVSDGMQIRDEVSKEILGPSTASILTGKPVRIERGDKGMKWFVGPQ